MTLGEVGYIAYTKSIGAAPESYSLALAGLTMPEWHDLPVHVQKAWADAATAVAAMTAKIAKERIAQKRAKGASALGAKLATWARIFAVSRDKISFF